MKQLIASIRVAARERFKGNSPRVWFVMLAEDKWQALVLNAESKEVLASACANTDVNALTKLKDKLEIKAVS